jgi:hypothetical protein
MNDERRLDVNRRHDRQRPLDYGRPGADGTWHTHALKGVSLTSDSGAVTLDSSLFDQPAVVFA